MLVQKLLQSPDVLHRRPQRLHFAHFLVGSAVGHMLTQRLETHVDLFDPVPLSFVPPGHGHGLLLGNGITQAVESEASFAAQELRRAGALSLQHLGFALKPGGGARRVGMDGGGVVLRWGVQGEAAARKSEGGLRGADGCSLHL